MVVSKEGPKEPKELEIKSQSHQTMNDFLRMVRDEDFLDFIQECVRNSFSSSHLLRLLFHTMQVE